jgi:hypothetical protein
MAVINGYATREQFQNYIATYATGTTAEELNRIANDNTFIDSVLTDASRMIDGETGRQFYISTGTHYYNYTPDREIFFDNDVVSVISVTNGDGTIVPSTEYNLFPLNGSPKYSISLKFYSTYFWLEDDDGNWEGVISIVLTQGYTATVPADIELACLIIAVALYRQRNGKSPIEGGFVTPQGTILLPGGIPKTAAQILARYKKRGFTA